MKTHQFSLEDEGVSLVISLTMLQSPPTPYVIKHAKITVVNHINILVQR